MLRIRDAIIAQAVSDYKDIVDGKIKKYRQDCNLKELKRFFESEYCDTLLATATITGRQILDYLEEYKVWAFRRRLKKMHKQLALSGNKGMEEARVILRLLIDGNVFLTYFGADMRVLEMLRKMGVDMVVNDKVCAVATLKYNPNINKNRPPEFTFIP